MRKRNLHFENYSTLLQGGKYHKLDQREFFFFDDEQAASVCYDYYLEAINLYKGALAYVEYSVTKFPDHKWFEIGSIKGDTIYITRYDFYVVPKLANRE